MEVQNWSFMQLLGAFGPLVLLYVAIIFASIDALPQPLAKGQHADVGSLGIAVDACVRGYGPLVPLILFFTQWICMPYDWLVQRGVIREKHGIPFLPECFARAAFVVWIIIVAVRILLFKVIRPYHYYFSDHIFLITSMVGMMQMKIYFAHLAHVKSSEADSKEDVKSGCWATMIVGWVLTAMCAIEAFNTAKYYHTVQATWTAFFAGQVLFGGVVVWWVYCVQAEPNGYKPLNGRSGEKA